jgi:hypothetical protein
MMQLHVYASSPFNLAVRCYIGPDVGPTGTTGQSVLHVVHTHPDSSRRRMAGRQVTRENATTRSILHTTSGLNMIRAETGSMGAEGRWTSESPSTSSAI